MFLPTATPPGARPARAVRRRVAVDEHGAHREARAGHHVATRAPGDGDRRATSTTSDARRASLARARATPSRRPGRGLRDGAAAFAGGAHAWSARQAAASDAGESSARRRGRSGEAGDDARRPRGAHAVALFARSSSTARSAADLGLRSRFAHGPGRAPACRSLGVEARLERAHRAVDVARAERDDDVAGRARRARAPRAGRPCRRT